MEDYTPTPCCLLLPLHLPSAVTLFEATLTFWCTVVTAVYIFFYPPGHGANIFYCFKL